MKTTTLLLIASVLLFSSAALDARKLYHNIKQEGLCLNQNEAE